MPIGRYVEPVPVKAGASRYGTSRRLELTRGVQKTLHSLGKGGKAQP